MVLILISFNSGKSATGGTGAKTINENSQVTKWNHMIYRGKDKQKLCSTNFSGEIHYNIYCGLSVFSFPVVKISDTPKSILEKHNY